MPFGKHKGTLLEDVPSDYLRWVLNNVQDLRYDLKYEIKLELDERQERRRAEWAAGAARSASAASSIPAIQIDSIIRDWFRQLAQRWHPDHQGGDTRVMTAINDARDLLQAMIRGAA